MSSIPAQPHTFVEVDREIFSTAILHLLLIQEGLLSVTSESMCREYGLITWFKTVARLTDHPVMTIAVVWDVKLQSNKENEQFSC